MDRRQHSLLLRRLRKGVGGEACCQNRAEKEDELLCVPVHARHSILRSVL